MEFDEYVRKTYTIKAIQVTAENISDVAAWLNTEIRVNRPKHGDLQHVMMPDGVRNGYQHKIAVFIGDWITEVDGTLHREKDKRFRDIFEPVDHNEYWDWQNQGG